MNRWLYAAVGTSVALVLAAACNGGDGGDRTPTVGETPARGQNPAGSETPAQGGATPDIKMIGVMSFDRSELTIAADSEVTIVAENIDGLHNFAIFEDEEYRPGLVEPIAKTDPCFSPCTGTLAVNLTPGEYVFRCQIHPEEMVGTLTAQQEPY